MSPTDLIWTPDALSALLRHPDPAMRAWALRHREQLAEVPAPVDDALPEDVLDAPPDESDASSEARARRIAAHPEALPRLLAASIATEPPRAIAEVLRAVGWQNSRAAAELIRGASTRVLDLGETALLMQSVESLGDPSLLPAVLDAWRPGEFFISRAARVLAMLGAGVATLPAAVRDEADANLRLQEQMNQVQGAGPVALLGFIQSVPLRVQVRCNRCGRSGQHEVQQATLHPDRAGCARDGWDGVCFVRIIACKYCDAEDDYTLAPESVARLQAEALVGMQLDSAHANVEQGPRVAVGIPGLSNGVHIRRASDAVAWWRRRTEEAPADGEAWLRLGNILKKQDRFDAAIEAYRRAATIRPDDLDALGQWLELLLDHGRADEAAPLPMRILPLMTKPEVEPWFREGIASSLARMLQGAIAAGQPLGIEAAWSAPSAGSEVTMAVSAVDLRRVNDFARFASFLAHPAVISLRLVVAEGMERGTQLESLLNGRAPVPSLLWDARTSGAPLTPTKRVEPKVGRNDPCPCGSGKKYKKCHG
jgi:hypothetical protein